LEDELRELADRRGATLYTMIGRRPPGAQTWMSAADKKRGVTLTSVFPDLDQSDLYVCGPPEWTDLVTDDARRAGMPEHRIHTERFDW
ncbi:MAG TPA: oxidoreductase, partial [Pseudolysinimonas sp.]